MIPDNIVKQIEDFLAKKIPSEDGRYAVPEKGDINKMYYIINAISKAKYGENENGDTPIEASIVDRSQYCHMYFIPIPYRHLIENTNISDSEKLAKFDTRLDDIAFNLRMAHADLDHELKMRLFDKEQKQKV